MPRLNAHKKIFGFTLIEILVIIMISGILSAIAIPSFISLVDKVNLNNAVTEVRAALQTGQREAIRRSQVCTIGLNIVERTVTGYCLSSDRNLPEKVDFATNISKDFNSPGNPVKIDFGILGSAKFTVIDLDGSQGNLTLQTGTGYLEMSFQPSPSPPIDPTGKIVLYIDNNPALAKKCIAISNILGLTRTGNYTGEITGDRITSPGTCNAS